MRIALRGICQLHAKTRTGTPKTRTIHIGQVKQHGEQRKRNQFATDSIPKWKKIWPNAFWHRFIHCIKVISIHRRKKKKDRWKKRAISIWFGVWPLRFEFNAWQIAAAANWLGLLSCGLEWYKSHYYYFKHKPLLLLKFYLFGLRLLFSLWQSKCESSNILPSKWIK